MDEKTEELRDLFLDVADEETVTESQEETPGSLTEERPAEERLDPVIERMREEYDFATDASTETYRRVVIGFFDDESDEELAERLGVPPDEVFEMRMDLHLLREEDADLPFELADLRERLEADGSRPELAAELGINEELLRRGERVLKAREEARIANDRYRDEFEEIATDGDLTARLARDAREDGLEDATEGMENDLEM